MPFLTTLTLHRVVKSDSKEHWLSPVVRARRIQPGQVQDLDDAVAWVEQALTPSDEDPVERGAVWGIGAVRVTLHVRL